MSDTTPATSTPEFTKPSSSDSRAIKDTTTPFPVVLEKTSASSLKSYKECPCRWFGDKYLTTNKTSNHSAAIGTVVHKVLEEAANMMKDEGKLPTPKTALDLWMDAALKAEKLGEEDRGEVSALVNTAYKLDYFKSIKFVLGTELGFGFLLPNGVKLTGFIDRADGNKAGTDIKDLKTQKKPFSKKELEFNHQAIIYTLAMRDKFPELADKPIYVSFWLLRLNRIQRIEFTPSNNLEVEIAQLESETEDMKWFINAVSSVGNEMGLPFEEVRENARKKAALAHPADEEAQKTLSATKYDEWLAQQFFKTVLPVVADSDSLFATRQIAKPSYLCPWCSVKAFCPFAKSF